MKVGGASYGSFTSGGNEIVSFSYSSGFSTRTFSISEDNTKPNSFDLSSPVDGKSTTKRKPTFSWSKSSSPDIENYKLIIGGSTRSTVVSSTNSAQPDSGLSCGNHEWKVKAIDKANNSNTTNSRTINISCGGGSSFSSSGGLPLRLI